MAKLDEDLATAFSGPDALVCPGSKLRDFSEKRIYRLDEVRWEEQRFDVVCLNEFRTTGSRDAENTAVYRSGLIEIDFFRDTRIPVPPSDQEAIIKECGVPWSLKVYTGGKGGWHWIWCLDEPFTSPEDYAYVNRLLLDDIIPHADKSNKNANKFRRKADVPNTVSGVTQELVECRGRVKRRDLLAFLEKHNEHVLKRRRAERKQERKSRALQALIESGHLDQGDWQALASERTKRFIEQGATDGDRHEETKSAVLNLMWTCGLEPDTVFELLKPAVDISGIGDRGDLENLIEWALRAPPNTRK
jgi:hypothetical protein